jgi:hypothetical protein
VESQTYRQSPFVRCGQDAFYNFPIQISPHPELIEKTEWFFPSFFTHYLKMVVVAVSAASSN